MAFGLIRLDGLGGGDGGEVEVGFNLMKPVINGSNSHFNVYAFSDSEIEQSESKIKIKRNDSGVFIGGLLSKGLGNGVFGLSVPVQDDVVLKLYFMAEERTELVLDSVNSTPLNVKVPRQSTNVLENSNSVVGFVNFVNAGSEKFIRSRTWEGWSDAGDYGGKIETGYTENVTDLNELYVSMNNNNDGRLKVIRDGSVLSDIAINDNDKKFQIAYNIGVNSSDGVYPRDFEFELKEVDWK